MSAYGNTGAHGAAIVVVDVREACTLSELHLHHNLAPIGSIPPGGALSVERADCVIANSLFEDNVAEARGGGLVLIGGVVSLENTIIRGNQAREGGGLYVLSWNKDTTVEADADTVIENNYATMRGGGAVAYVYGDYTVTLRGFSAATASCE